MSGALVVRAFKVSDGSSREGLPADPTRFDIGRDGSASFTVPRAHYHRERVFRTSSEGKLAHVTRCIDRLANAGEPGDALSPRER
jgi:hypothetical protein